MREVSRIFGRRSGTGASAIILVAAFVARVSAADTAARGVIFDPEPTGILFPVAATPHEARQVAFGGQPQGPWAVFSRWQEGSDHGAFVRRSAGPKPPAMKRSRAKPNGPLPIGCEAIGSIKSELGTLAGRCIASL